MYNLFHSVLAAPRRKIKGCNYNFIKITFVTLWQEMCQNIQKSKINIFYFTMLPGKVVSDLFGNALNRTFLLPLSQQDSVHLHPRHGGASVPPCAVLCTLARWFIGVDEVHTVSHMHCGRECIGEEQVHCY